MGRRVGRNHEPGGEYWHPRGDQGGRVRGFSQGHARQRPCRRHGRRASQRATGRFIWCAPSFTPDDRRADAGLLRLGRDAGDCLDGMPTSCASGWQRVHHANVEREARAGGPHRLVMRRVDCRPTAGRRRRESGALPRGHRLCSKRAFADQGIGGATLAGHEQGARLRREHPEVHP